MNLLGVIKIPKDFKRDESIRILLIGSKSLCAKHSIDTYHTIFLIGSPVMVRDLLFTFTNKPLLDDACIVLSETAVEVTADGVKILDVALGQMPCLPKEMKQSYWKKGYWENSIHTGCERYLDMVASQEIEINIRAISDMRLSKACEMLFSIDIDSTVDCVEIGRWKS